MRPRYFNLGFYRTSTPPKIGKKAHPLLLAIPTKRRSEWSYYVSLGVLFVSGWG